MDNIYINKVLNGDTEAFRYFVKMYKDYAFSLSYSIVKNQFLAEESVQISFIKAFENLASFKRDAKFKTWLGRIVINESLRKAETNKGISAPLEEQFLDSEETINTNLKALMLNEQTTLITSVFESIQPNESLVLDLYYLKENSVQEIVELTGWSKSKIKMLLLRGRQHFYNKLSKSLKLKLEEII